MCSIRSTIYIVKSALFITKAAIFHNNIQSALCIGKRAIVQYGFYNGWRLWRLQSSDQAFTLELGSFVFEETSHRVKNRELKA